MNEKHFYQAESNKTFEKVISDLEQSVVDHGFLVLSKIDIQKKFLLIGKPSNKMSVVQICNPEISYQAITLNNNLICMMPKDISVFVDSNNKVKVVFMRPDISILEDSFPSINISELSTKVGYILQNIVEAAI